MSKGIDTTENCTNHTAAIKAAGYTFVGRYYSQQFATPHSWKDLSLREASALSDAGLYIVSVYEDNPTSAAYFSAERGTADAQRAVVQAKACGQPRGTPIYFSVDYDAARADTDALRRYFSMASVGTYASGYAIGVYGSGFVCDIIEGYLQHDGCYIWLAGATGWQGYKAMVNLASVVQGHTVTVAGMECDTNVANNGGGWKVA